MLISGIREGRLGGRGINRNMKGRGSRGRGLRRKWAWLMAEKAGFIAEVGGGGAKTMKKTGLQWAELSGLSFICMQRGRGWWGWGWGFLGGRGFE